MIRSTFRPLRFGISDTVVKFNSAKYLSEVELVRSDTKLFASFKINLHACLNSYATSVVKGAAAVLYILSKMKDRIRPRLTNRQTVNKAHKSMITQSLANGKVLQGA